MTQGSGVKSGKTKGICIQNAIAAHLSEHISCTSCMQLTFLVPPHIARSGEAPMRCTCVATKLHKVNVNISGAG